MDMFVSRVDRSFFSSHLSSKNFFLIIACSLITSTTFSMELSIPQAKISAQINYSPGKEFLGWLKQRARQRSIQGAAISTATLLVLDTLVCNAIQKLSKETDSCRAIDSFASVLFLTLSSSAGSFLAETAKFEKNYDAVVSLGALAFLCSVFELLFRKDMQRSPTEIEQLMILDPKKSYESPSMFKRFLIMLLRNECACMSSYWLSKNLPQIK